MKATQHSPMLLQMAAALRSHELSEPVHLQMKPLTAEETTPLWT